MMVLLHNDVLSISCKLHLKMIVFNILVLNLLDIQNESVAHISFRVKFWLKELRNCNHKLILYPPQK